MMDGYLETTPTPTSVATVPVAILAAVSRAIVGWTTAVYPGKTAYLEAASRDPAARRPYTWHATARLSNGVRLRFTVVVHNDGAACVTRHARLADADADADAGARTRRSHQVPSHGAGDAFRQTRTS